MVAQLSSSIRLEVMLGRRNFPLLRNAKKKKYNLNVPLQSHEVAQALRLETIQKLVRELPRFESD